MSVGAAREGVWRTMAVNYVTTDLNVSKVSFSWAARYMQVQMLRNCATPTWVFKKQDGKESLPGCIIAAPSIPDRDVTDQDYVHFWVRDGAVCIVEAVDNLISGNGVLDDYVTFSRVCQVNALNAGHPDRACFLIDGAVRDWSDQGDGTAHRIDSLIEIFNHLGPAARETALVVIRDDLDQLLQVYGQPTFNLWEETEGKSFFARSVQLKALRRLILEPDKYGVTAQVGAIKAAISSLVSACAEHARLFDGIPYYESILDAPNGSRGATLNSDVVMAVTYGAASCRDDRILSTAALLRRHFAAAFPVNAEDAKLGLGPVIGRYEGDTYDGNSAGPNEGHPWALTTCNFADLYYRVAAEILTEGSNSLLTTNSTAFFAQVGIALNDDPAAVGKLVAAGDAMLAAVVYHSDQLELSEQIDRNSGYQKSVRSLSWSYAAFLRALKARKRAVGESFGAH
jgi:glucoamylase